METGTHSLTKSLTHSLAYSLTLRDACVPYTDNQAWTEGMGYPVEHPWKPWAFVAADNTTQVGGYEVVYDVSGVGIVTYSLTYLLTYLLTYSFRCRYWFI